MKTLKNTLIISSALSCLLSINSFAQAWDKAQPLPFALQEIYSDTHNGMLYIAGGIPEDDKNYADLFMRFNPKVSAWESLTPLPNRRHHITLSATAENLYAIGGFVGAFPNWQAQPSVYVYSFLSQQWSTSTPLPQPRGEHVAEAVDGKVYVIGGRVTKTASAAHFNDHIDTTSSQVFDPKTGKWMDITPALTARNSAASAVIKGKIYVVGGRQNEVNDKGDFKIVNVPNLEVYDPAKNVWVAKAPMPVAQSGLAAATVDNKLYVFGGEQWFPEQKVFANAWVYNPETDKWSALPNLPTPRHGLTAEALGSTIYTVGGATVPGLGAVNTHESFSVDKR
ncbi:Kelch repeat-containing protein [Agarilytica rhodophyticola]|uniref:Kelch repeat-containing protein n=1 Tax=Agarilytica rhodophyticola TaxID=1737490 RepID=UPI000B3481D8|nr:kelch repeat-containing protein [Agarilytica rhodophyticola]